MTALNGAASERSSGSHERGGMANAAGEQVSDGVRQAGERPAVLDMRSELLGGWVRVKAPDPAAPFWAEQDGTRHSYGSLRCGLDGDSGSELGSVHLEAIGQIARAAIEAAEHGDQGETARLAMAAGRLCQEIAGHWPPSAVEIPRR